jgi:DNA polymerase-1
MNSKYIIVDGSSLIHRAFYALPTLTTASGQYTNAVFGFTNMIVKLLADWQPDGMVVAFDKGKKTFRNEEYVDYKAQRKPTPTELSEQFPMAREVLEAMGITVLELDGFEADDIIGTLAAQASPRQEFLIVTGDRDALQLVNEHVHVLLTKKGISEFEEVDPAVLTFSYGLTPAQVIEMKGLMGDASDNIPGIPGVGEKTAKKLIADFGSIDGVYANIDQVAGAKLKEKILSNRDLAYLSRKLATIHCQAPVPTDIAQYSVKPDMEKSGRWPKNSNSGPCREKWPAGSSVRIPLRRRTLRQWQSGRSRRRQSLRNCWNRFASPASCIFTPSRKGASPIVAFWEPGFALPGPTPVLWRRERRLGTFF